MEEATVKYLLWILFGIVGIVITFYVFGAELPLYLIFASMGLLLYMYSKNPLLEFIGGWLGRVCAVLFLVSLLYYFGTGTFFPSDPFKFRFAIVGIRFAIDSFNTTSEFIGKLVLNLIDKIFS